MSETPFLPPTDTALGEGLRAAYAGGEGCPPPQLLLEEAEGGLAPAEREALAAHVSGCPACAAELRLARSFAAPNEAAVDAADLRFVVERLRRNAPVRAAEPAGGRVVPFPAAPREKPASRSALLRRVAAVGLFVLAAGLAWRLIGGAGDPLPAPELSDTVRGAEIEGLAPAGELAALPAELRWEPWRGAASYRVQISAVDGAVLWQATVAGPPVRLPAELLRRLQPAVRYTWTVSALGPEGAAIAVAEPASFRARPR